MASGFQPPWLYIYIYYIGEQPTADLHYMLEGFLIVFSFQPVSQAVKCGVSNIIFCMNWHACPVLLTASFYGSATDLKRGSDVPFDPLLEGVRTSKVQTDDRHICSLDQQVIAIGIRSCGLENYRYEHQATISTIKYIDVNKSPFWNWFIIFLGTCISTYSTR